MYSNLPGIQIYSSSPLLFLQIQSGYPCAEGDQFSPEVALYVRLGSHCIQREGILAITGGILNGVRAEELRSSN